MLTEDKNTIRNYHNVASKFANIAYNSMLQKRYGIKSCKSCGDLDIVGGKNIHVIEYEKMLLSQMRDCDFVQTIECK
jgi:hypothetical protein